LLGRPPLSVWLYGVRIATLAEHSYGRLRFTFEPEAEEQFRAGSPLLSTSMPVDTIRRPRADIVRAFFYGLLPEGPSRTTIARAFGLTPGDDFGLLAAIGRDCAGAIVLLPADESLPESGELEPLEPGDLEALIRGLGDRPLGADMTVRVSLPGVQEKLLLAKAANGEWARPINGAPSTHIFKPQDMRFDSYAVSEAFCLELARRLDLVSYESQVVEIADRPVIVVQRYDRVETNSGVTRVHQEDACQALGVDTSTDPHRKYQAGRGPGLRDMAKVLADYQPLDRGRLLALVTLNVTVGNADCHAKNISILHPADGTVHLAPAYDVTPTSFYTGIPTETGPKDMTDELGMFVNGVRSIHKIAVDDLVAEGASWGLGPEAARVVEVTLACLQDSLADVAARTGLPNAILDFCGNRLASILAGRPAGHVPAG
jgi:serine/threonine-protein kinase HipA